MRYLVKRIPSTSLVHYDGSRYYCEIAGGTAEKATVDTAELLSGSKYLDAQTGNWYVYDELSDSWALSQEGGSADPATIEAAVQDWLDDHPEATTTVEDGSITEAKLAQQLAAKVGQISSLSDEIDGIGSDVTDLQSAFNVETGNISAPYTVVTGAYISTAGILSALTGTETQRTIVVHGKPNTEYHIKKATSTIMRAGLGTSGSLTVGAHLVGYTGHTLASMDELIVITDDDNVYIYIQLYAGDDAVDLRSIDANVRSLVVFEKLAINDDKVSVFNAYSSAKTEQIISQNVENAIEPLVEIGVGKNIFNPSETESGRLYSNQAGNKQTHTTSSTERIIRIPAQANLSYAMSGISFYSFVDKDDILLIATTSTGSTHQAVAIAPTNTAYLWIQTNNTRYNTETQIEIGDKVSAYEPYREKASYIYKGIKIMDSKDLPSFFNMDDASVVNPLMTKVEFCAACNAAWADYAALNKIHTSSFYYFREYTNENAVSWDLIYKTLNHNFRRTVATNSMSMEALCNSVNKAFTNRIYRFCDAKPFTGNTRDFSLSMGFQADEPSAIVSEDGNTLYVYAHLKRIESRDGVTWGNNTNLVLSDSGYVMHVGIQRIDSVYYLIGARANSGGNLVLYTSTDGINFVYRGILFKAGFEFHSEYAVDNWGNPYIIKDYGTNRLILFIETQKTGTPWQINVASCTNILTENADDTIGNWDAYAGNPVINRPYNDYTSNSNTAGNPEFIVGADGNPIRYEGKYFMYFHSTLGGYSTIMRAYSYDLMSWTVEGPVVDNRDQPTRGDSYAGNADHCLAEFKGKTYFFYTWDINDPNNLPYIKYTVDDRNAVQMLSITP